MTCFEMMAYAALICFECFCCLGRSDRNASPPPSPKIRHYLISGDSDDLEACPNEIPTKIDWEMVERHED